MLMIRKTRLPSIHELFLEARLGIILVFMFPHDCITLLLPDPLDLSGGKVFLNSTMSLSPLPLALLAKAHPLCFGMINEMKPLSKSNFQSLYSFAINDLTLVHRVVNSTSLEDIFHRPLGVQAFGQFQQTQMILAQTQHSINNDKWSYCWN